MKVTVRNCDWIRGSLYFRKRISHKHLVSGRKNVEIKKALRPVTKKYYHILLDNHEELAKLSAYLNDRIDIFLKHKGRVEMIDIIEYINDLCDEYYQQAIIENSSLEIKRVQELEYINENGVQQGYSIQALAKEYKIIVTQYDNLDNTQKTIDIGSTVVKRSNITKEQLLEIRPNQLISFYEMLIKAEKAVLENDIKLYISRNLHQFISLISDMAQDQFSKVEEAYYETLKIIRENEPKIDYLNFIHKKKKEIVNAFGGMSKDELYNQIIQQLQTREKDKVLNTATNLNTLVDSFVNFKKYTAKREKSARRSIKLFTDFIEGNGAEYKAKTIEELTVEDMLEFEQLLIELKVRNKSKKFDNLTLFDLVKMRKEDKSARIGAETIDGIEIYIKDFWSFIAKHKKNIKIEKNLITVLRCKSAVEEIMEENEESVAHIRSFTMKELNTFLVDTYSLKELKKILISQPRNFWLFILGLLTGMRHEEALLINLNDIKMQIKDNKKYYYIYLNEDQTYQHLKNQSSHRNIPITELLISLGFLDYVNKRKKKGHTTLFHFTKTGATASNAFFQRHLSKLFPDFVLNDKNKDMGVIDSYIQFRSLRKNFSNFLFEEDRTSFDTVANKEKTMGHYVGGEKGRYMGRLEPFKAFTTLNAFPFEENINFNIVRETTSDFYDNVTELDWIEEEYKWNSVSKIKAKKGRRV